MNRNSIISMYTYRDDDWRLVKSDIDIRIISGSKNYWWSETVRFKIEPLYYQKIKHYSIYNSSYEL